METTHEVARASRIKVLELVHRAQTSHIGSLFSCADILAVLFNRIDFKKDVFVAGKSWAAALVYYHLWRRGRITEEQLNSYCKDGSPFIGLLEAVTPDVPFGIGSMGTGLPAAVGFALAKKLKGEEGTVYCLMSDGEMQIGTTWESALIAAHHKLDNLVVVVDVNDWQAMNRTQDVLDLSNLGLMWQSFGWETHVTDGHSYEWLEKNLARLSNRPIVLLANTVKGKGVSFFEDDNKWHYKSPNQDEYEAALQELNG